ncbi:MAG: glycosyltransferase family 4 protein [Planctomycetaceae bacterium]|nr:glycosyltransferase family 4 protein [Planctomycetaceae bacterium]
MPRTSSPQACGRNERRPSGATATHRVPAVRRRIAFITTIADTQWHFLHGQNQFLAERGFEIHAIASPGPMLDKLMQRDGVVVHAVPMSRSIHPLRDVRAILQLWRLLREVRPHLVHVSTPKAALVGSIAAWLAGVPARILLLRGLALEGSTGLRRQVLRVAESVAARLCHRTLCVSRSLREAACTEWIVNRHETAVPAQGMSNGVDGTRFDPRTVMAANLPGIGHRSIVERPPVIGFVGRMSKDKGLDVIADAFALVRREFPDARLLLVGGWDESSPPAEAVRTRLERDPFVHITGAVSDPETWLKCMTVFAFASRREGFPNAPMEAAAMEVPVVATEATGTTDAVLNGITGMLVPQGDATAMAGAICQYLRSPELRRRHGRAGRQRVLREFQPERIWEAMLSEYVGLLHERGLASPEHAVAAASPQRRAA